MLERRTQFAGHERKLKAQVVGGTPSQATGAKLVATRSHTAIILLILVGLAIGALVQMIRVPYNFVGSSGRVLLYGQILAVQLLLLWFVRAGTRRSGYSVRELVDESPCNLARCSRYLGLGIVAWLMWLIFSATLGFFLRPTSDELQAVLQFLPRGPIEKSCWIVFALVTNFCEEVLYRGYLMRQFRSFTGSATLALLLQAVVFGLGHVSLGMALTLSVSLLALFLGALALWQKSLVPGMIAHTSLSIFAGLISST